MHEAEEDGKVIEYENGNQKHLVFPEHKLVRIRLREHKRAAQTIASVQCHTSSTTKKHRKGSKGEDRTARQGGLGENPQKRMIAKGQRQHLS